MNGNGNENLWREDRWQVYWNCNFNEIIQYRIPFPRFMHNLFERSNFINHMQERMLNERFEQRFLDNLVIGRYLHPGFGEREFPIVIEIKTPADNEKSLNQVMQQINEYRGIVRLPWNAQRPGLNLTFPFRFIPAILITKNYGLEVDDLLKRNGIWIYRPKVNL